MSVAFSSVAKLLPTDAASGGLSQEIERHLRNYFAAHEHGGLPAAGLYDRILREVERPLLIVALEKCEGNQLKAARLLGVNRNTLRKKLRELGLLAPECRRAKARHSLRPDHAPVAFARPRELGSRQSKEKL